jgi:hypothetical protein
VLSGLDPNRGVYDKVVCSVCRGRGVIDPNDRAERAAGTPAWVPYLIAVILAVVAIGLAGWSAYRVAARTDDDPIDLLFRDSPTPNSDLTKDDLMQRVEGGMTKEKVKEVVGFPTLIKESPEGTDTWMFHCRDGRVMITFTDGKVYGKFKGK